MCSDGLELFAVPEVNSSNAESFVRFALLWGKLGGAVFTFWIKVLHEGETGFRVSHVGEPSDTFGLVATFGTGFG